MRALGGFAHMERQNFMREIMYSQSSVLIVSGLFISMLLAMEIGFQSGRRIKMRATETITQANAVLVSMLGLLALLLSFTFSAALQRYDDRSQTVVAEANAIGTAYLRARLLPVGMQDKVQALLRQYLDVRIKEGRVDSTEPELHESLLRQAKLLEAQLWSHAVRAAEQDGRVVTSGFFIQSLNELIDTSGTRNAALNRHVPEIVLFLMFATIVLTTATLGYASGIAGHRVTLAAFVLVMLIALVAYLIIDLDRPRRGVTQVSQESMLSLQQTIGAAQGHATQPGSPPDASQAPRR
jgi:ABC-type multidrug transport system fused ATPase/permease subunit